MAWFDDAGLNWALAGCGVSFAVLEEDGVVVAKQKRLHYHCVAAFCEASNEAVFHRADWDCMCWELQIGARGVL